MVQTITVYSYRNPTSPHTPKLTDAGFDRLYIRYRRYLVNTLVKYHATPEIAEECVQDAFTALWKRRSDIRTDDSGSMIRWLMKSSYRNFLKANRRDPPVSDVEHFDQRDPYDPYKIGFNPESLIAYAASGLPKKDRMLLNCFLSKKSYDNISTELGIPKGSIGPTRQRLLRRMRERLEGRGLTRGVVMDAI